MTLTPAKCNEPAARIYLDVATSPPRGRRPQSPANVLFSFVVINSASVISRTLFGAATAITAWPCIGRPQPRSSKPLAALGLIHHLIWIRTPYLVAIEPPDDAIYLDPTLGTCRATLDINDHARFQVRDRL